MSLITGVGYRDQFAIMSGDFNTLTAKYYMNKDGIIEDEEAKIYRCNVKSNKVHKLTDYVLFATTGLADLSAMIVEEFKKRLTDADDLGVCADVFRDIISDLRKLADSGDVSADVRSSLKALTHHTSLRLTCSLTGFYENGRTGIVTFETDEGPDAEVFVPDPPADEYKFDAICRGVSKATEIEHPFDLGPHYEDYTFINFLRRVNMLHTSVSLVNPKLVSPEYKIYILRNRGEDKPEFIEMDMDSNDHYHEISGRDLSVLKCYLNDRVCDEVLNVEED
ncbi:hypothetical protein ACTWQL_13795 [Pseudalkalibacillus sp. R45]|uniref:hypothetical protein n=1 Tax=Pseudalkalibacillus sp. R45 TaxID=3457433 RepID=UPI003FCD27C3